MNTSVTGKTVTMNENITSFLYDGLTIAIVLLHKQILNFIISLIPASINYGEFIHEIKEIVGLLTVLAAFVITIIRLIRTIKKPKQHEKDDSR